MHDLHHVINGRRYRIRFAPLDDAHGVCTSPHEPRPTITICDKLQGRDLLQTLLHESLHAAGWWLSEEWVDDTAADLAALLIRLGYRKHEAR